MFGQAPDQASQVYEGQIVSAIDLIANPNRDVEPLRSQIVQKVGQPYSNKDVQASRQALQHTGKFPKVEAQVTPDPNGLRVSFVLEPAYRLGIVDFPELSRRFAYTRLLQIANLPDEEPYTASHLPLAETSV